MTSIILPIIFLIIMFVFFILFLTINKRQEKTLKTIDKDGKIKDNNNDEKSVKNKVEEKKGPKKEDVFKFMEFDRILDDMIVQNGGSRFTMAIKCKGINYDLMSEVEQLAVEEGFITFLNTLKYPIQLYVQAQNIDLKKVVEKYKQNVADISNKYENINKEYSKLVSSFDVDEKKLDRVTKERNSIANVYEYANDMITYVEHMSGNKNLLQRNFYVLVSYSTAEITAADKFDKDELIEMCFTELNTRCTSIISALASCSVSGKILDSNELADLLYSAYNRDDKGLMGVQEALESGIFRLYSTSEDAIYKKTVALDEYLKNEAKIKALESMRAVIEQGEIETPASQAIDEQEEISKRATNMIKSEDYDQDFKNKVNKKILDDFRETKRELLEIDKQQKKEIIEENNKDMETIEELKSKEKPKGIQLIEKSKELGNLVKKSKDEIDQNLNSENENTNLYDNSNNEDFNKKGNNENDSIV